MTQIVLGRWGHSLALRLPGDIVQSSQWLEGERVEIAAEDGVVTIRRAEAPVDLQALFCDRAPQAWRDAYAEAFAWGPDVGREAVPE